MRKTMVMVSILALGWSAAGAETSKDLNEDVRKVETAFAKTLADRDYAAFKSFLADDAIFFTQRQGVRRGKASVAEAWKLFYEGKDAPFSWAPEDVEVLESGGLAFSSGPVFAPDGQRVGTYNSVWRKEKDGEWRIIFDKGCPRCECPPPEKRSTQ